MSFKNFNQFSEALATLRKQLETNSLLIRVVNRISSLISNAQSIPAQYTGKYNSVQLLQYDSNGNLLDITPESQLSVPDNVLKQAVADITSNQQLAESDLKVFGDVASVISSQPVVGFPGSDAFSDETDFFALSSNLVRGRLLTTGFVDGGKEFLNEKPHLVLERDQVEARFVDGNHQADPMNLTLKGISWITHDYSSIDLNNKRSDGSHHLMLMIHVTPDLVPPILSTEWKTCAYVVSGRFSGYRLQLRLQSADSKGFSSRSDQIIHFTTNDSAILFTGDSTAFPGYKGINEEIAGVSVDKDANSLTRLLYPKAALEALKTSLL